MRIAAEGRANTAGKKCGKQSWEDTIGLERQLWSNEERGETGDFGGSS